MNDVLCSWCRLDLPDYMMREQDDLLLCPKCNSNFELLLSKARKKEPYDAPDVIATTIARIAGEESAKAKEQRAQALARAAEAKREAEERAERIKAEQEAFERQHQEAIKQQEKERTARELARKELARRALASKHLLPFVKYHMPTYQAGWVHKDICRRLERFSEQVARGESPRLMLAMPPRHGKSQLASQSFPGWHLGRYPTHDIITASYSAALATDFSKKVRALVKSPGYQAIFPGSQIDPDNQNAEGWSMNKGGMYVPAGVGGPMTGRGAHILIIDDPVKNREEAESDTQRQSIKDWYTSTAYTRLAPGGGVLVIQTRWHEDDLSGWLLSEMEDGNGDDWEVIKYPAIAIEDELYRSMGDALHPDRYPLSALQRIKNAVGRRDWQALYQQDPIGEEGDFFQGRDFQYYRPDDLPALGDMTVYAAWDLAIGTKEHNDFTVGVVFGIDRALNLWMLDLYRGRWGSLEIVDKLFECYDKWEPAITGIERTHVEQAIGPLISEQKRRRNKYGMRIEPLKPGRRDKVARAQPIRGLIELRRVYFPALAPWKDDFVSELLKFPNGKHDDCVDGIAWIGQMVEMFNPRPMPRSKPKKSWRDNLKKFVTSGPGTTSHMAS